MIFKKSLKISLFQAANILVGIFLLSIFFITGRNVVQTFAVANIAALGNLQPQPMDYFWELNIHQAPLDKNKIRYYADYYEHLLQAFPGLWDAYGVLGYCYHYLNDDPKAIKFLNMAIHKCPDYFWNYYNLAAIYINESRYEEASGLLQKALNVDPSISLEKMAMSQWVYAPLLGTDEKEVLIDSGRHLKNIYRASYLLTQVLNQAEDKKQIQEMIRKINPELYAF